MIITIIGLGLIGGSVAIDLKQRGFANYIIGVETNTLHAKTALKIGMVDEISELLPAVLKSNITIIATPVDEAVKLLPLILDNIDKQIITDLCSTKNVLCNIVKNHNKRKNYVAAHPLAGTEFSGPLAAKSGLFDGTTAVLCDVENNEAETVSVIKALFNTLNMRVVEISAYVHDIHVAYISHLSHISSFALALTAFENVKNKTDIFNLAGGGFTSTVRLAKSPASMWSPILIQNAENIVNVIDSYIKHLNNFKEAIIEKDYDKITSLITASNKIEKIIK